MSAPIGKPQRRPVERRGPLEQSSESPVRPEPEIWIDEGSVRRAATQATRRAGAAVGTSESPSRGPRTVRRGVRPESVATAEPIKVAAVTGPRAAVLQAKVQDAQGALERERFGDARRMVTTVLREAPDMSSAQEILGLSQYRLGNYRQAAVALERFRELGGGVTNHPVLADCYRAMRQWDRIEPLWDELRAASPSAALVAEGRIVVAGALADRGDIAAAIALLRPSERVPSRVRDHHLRLWYVLADLYDRHGEPTKARSLFGRIRAHAGDFADVDERLRALGA